MHYSSRGFVPARRSVLFPHLWLRTALLYLFQLSVANSAGTSRIESVHVFSFFFYWLRFFFFFPLRHGHMLTVTFFQVYVCRTQTFLSFQKHTNNPPLTHSILAGAMMADLWAIGGDSPHPFVRPKPKSDDKERLLDRRVQFDEPRLAKLVAQETQCTRDLTRELCDQMRAKPPAVPNFLSRELLVNLERGLPCVPNITF